MSVFAEIDEDGFEMACLSADAGLTVTVEVNEEIEDLTCEIVHLKHEAGNAILEIGRKLIRAKELLSHGEWLPWLNEKVEFSERSAQNFMRLSEQYSNPQTVADLGASKALVLLALEPIQREEFMAETHMISGEEKSVSEMSKRELEQAIKGREQAIEDCEKALADRDIAEEREEAANREVAEVKSQVSHMKEEVAMLQGQEQIRKNKVATLEEQVAKAKEREQKAKAELTELKSKPIEVAVAEPSTEMLAQLKAEALAEATAQVEVAQAEVEQLRRALQMADGFTASFAVMFKNWQGSYSDMVSTLAEVAARDPEKAGKLRQAVAVALTAMEEGLGA